MVRSAEIVAHDLRLAAVQRAEKIVVMDRGRCEMLPVGAEVEWHGGFHSHGIVMEYMEVE